LIFLVAEPVSAKKGTPTAEPHVLVPELALLSSLPLHLQRRFAIALEIMHSEQGCKLNWQQVAEKSAISPAHFHRQFKALFFETPGQYLSRQQITRAVIQLLQNPEYSITAVAVNTGFSSSQALAKALNRQLGMTARELREMAASATPAQTSEVFNKLSQPAKEGTVEWELATTMPLTKCWFEQRGMKIKKVKEADWDYLCEHYWHELTHFRMQTPIYQLDRDWSEIQACVGDTQATRVTHNAFLPGGYYLCTEVLVGHATAYMAALELLFERAEAQGFSIDYSGYLVESVLNTDNEHGLTFSFQIPLRS